MCARALTLTDGLCRGVPFRFTSATALRPSMKRKRTEDNEEGDGSEEGTEGRHIPAQRQTKLITSPFFSSAKDDGESAADLRDKKRLCSTRSSAIAAKYGRALFLSSSKPSKTCKQNFHQEHATGQVLRSQ